jgi:hypothetical protein
MKLIVAVLLITLAACATAPAGQSLTPQQQVFQIESNYKVALDIANAYVALPRCGQPTSPPLCSKSETIVALQKANATVMPLLAAAQKTVTDPTVSAGGAQAAVTAAANAQVALSQITSTLTVK